jgi:uncharacterized protein
MSKIIISDTSCLIALSRINRLDILHYIFSTIVTTEEVQREFGQPLPSWLEVKQVKNESKFEEIKKLLDQGEASAIALALETENAVLVIDEKKGRKIAKELNIEIIGTLRILLFAKQEGIIPSVKDLIQKLHHYNFRFAKSIIDQILKEAGEA